MPFSPQTMIDLLQAFLQTGVGVGSITHPDGRKVTMDRAQAMEELAFWNAQKDLQANSGLTFSRMGLKGDA